MPSSLILFPRLGVTGIAIATSFAGWVSVLFLGQRLVSSGLFRPSGQTVKRIGLILVAAALMGSLLWWVEASFPQFLLEGTLLVRLVSVFITVIAAVTVYFGFAFLTGGLDRAEFARLFKRRKSV